MSSGVSDVRRTPRLVSWLALLQEVGIPAKGKGENPSQLFGVRSKTPRLVAQLFVGFSVLEELKVNGSGSNSGDQMKVPRVIAWTSKQAVG